MKKFAKCVKVNKYSKDTWTLNKVYEIQNFQMFQKYPKFIYLISDLDIKYGIIQWEIEYINRENNCFVLVDEDEFLNQNK